MDLVTLFILAVGLAMDAFAVSICKGLATRKFKLKNALIVGLWFGGFQALMPLIGYLLGTLLADFVSATAPYIAFGLLAFIGGNMIKESFSKEEGEDDASLNVKEMFILAIATSIDALAVGVTFAFLKVNIVAAISFIGIVTFIISGFGVAIGTAFGVKYKSKAELAGGVILILIGLKTLLEHFIEIPTSVYFQMILLIIGFVLLIKGADVFVEGAGKTASKLGIPQIVIGLTVVAFGTSAPEAAISITAAASGSSGLAVGNILGSNIMNVLLILGIASCITPLAIQKTTLFCEIPYVFVISCVLMVLGMIGNVLGIVDGIVLWIFMIGFIIYLLIITKKGLVESEEVEELGPKDTTLKLILMLVIGAICIVIGSRFTVSSASAIAKTFGMSERLIGLTIVAFGTSLPELITSVTAAMKKKADIAVGNIVGSNLFNILFVLGTASLVAPIEYSAACVVDNIVAIVVMLVLFVFVLRDRKLHRFGGITMLIGYGAYFAYLCVMQLSAGV